MALPCIKAFGRQFCPFCEHSWQVGGTVWANAVSEFAEDLPNRRRSKMDKIAVNAFIHGRAISTVLDMSHKKCRTYVQSPSYMKTAYWFAPTFFIVNNVESRRCTLQNKHLFENPWVGAHSVRTENHCLSTQSVRVWFAVLTIGDASPQTKDFLPNAHLSCVPVAFGP